MRVSLVILTLVFTSICSDAFAQLSLNEMSEKYCTVFNRSNPEKLTNFGTFCPLGSGTVKGTRVIFPNEFRGFFSNVRMIDGYVILRLSVTEIGTTTNCEVIDSYYKDVKIISAPDGSEKEVVSATGGTLLHRSAIKSARRFRFDPTMKGDKAIQVDNVIIKISFLL